MFGASQLWKDLLQEKKVGMVTRSALAALPRACMERLEAEIQLLTQSGGE